MVTIYIKKNSYNCLTQNMAQFLGNARDKMITNRSENTPLFADQLEEDEKSAEDRDEQGDIWTDNLK